MADFCEKLPHAFEGLTGWDGAHSSRLTLTLSPLVRLLLPLRRARTPPRATRHSSACDGSRLYEGVVLAQLPALLAARAGVAGLRTRAAVARARRGLAVHRLAGRHFAVQPDEEMQTKRTRPARRSQERARPCSPRLCGSPQCVPRTKIIGFFGAIHLTHRGCGLGPPLGRSQHPRRNIVAPDVGDAQTKCRQESEHSSLHLRA
jgi:hypothetical protein